MKRVLFVGIALCPSLALAAPSHVPVAKNAKAQIAKAQIAKPNVVRIGDTLICSGVALMGIPSGGKQFRSIEIRIPSKFIGTPTVTATIVPTQGPGTLFGIYSIKVNPLGNETQVAIEAKNVENGVGVPFRFVCNYVIVGNTKSVKQRP